MKHHRSFGCMRDIYGGHIDTSCLSFGPRLPLALMKGDFVNMTKVKDQFRFVIEKFIMKGSLKDPKEIRVLPATMYLQGDHDQFVYCKVYWGN
jgi:hypothetical protein